MRTFRNIVPALVGLLVATVWSVQAAEPTLKVGNQAPKLQTGKWIQGDPVEQFARDKAYLVEFWATWCGPCRTTIPHLDALHRKFADKGLVVIGQDVWERDESEVPRFVKSMGEKMTYRVALDDKQGSARGRMADTWMAAAGRNGIPSAFLVDKQGVIAWIGHPMELKESLIEQVLAGTFDVAKAAQVYATRLKNEAEMRSLQVKLGQGMERQDWKAVDEALAGMEKLTPAEDRDQLALTRFRVELERKDFAAARKLARSVADAHKDDAGLQNEVAWALVTAGEVDKETLGLAEEIAVRANRVAGGKEAAIVDTLARVLFMKGDKARAIALQEEAVTLSEGRMKSELQRTLESYRAGKLPAAN